MIDDNDIQKLSEVFATKLDFEKFKEEYRKDFSKFLTKIDKNIEKDADEKQEKIMLEGKVNRHDKWISQIAEKVDLKLES
jgi:hypothetical protein